MENTCSAQHDQAHSAELWGTVPCYFETGTDLCDELLAQARGIMMLTKETADVLEALALVLSTAWDTNAQRVRGELRIEVRDPQGAAVPTEAELVSEANQFRRTFRVGLDGRYVVQDLAFGVYRLSVRTEGFAPWSGLVEVRSEVPVRVSVSLGLAPVATQVQVSDSATLLDLCLAIILLEMEDGAIPHCGRVVRRRELNQTAPTDQAG